MNRKALTEKQTISILKELWRRASPQRPLGGQLRLDLPRNTPETGFQSGCFSDTLPVARSLDGHARRRRLFGRVSLLNLLTS